MGSAEAKTFIQKVAPIIQQKAKERGYKVCSPIIAQAVIESRYGESGLAKFNNFFGLKCGSAWKGPSVNMKTKEEYNSQLVSIRDNFRVFPSLEAGIDGYFDFVSTKRYANLKSATTPEEYLKRIKADGYATSSSYVNTNMNCIRKYDLTKYDTISDTPGNPYELSSLLLKYGSRGESVKWLQYELNQHGANLKIDGIYGQLTKLAVILYQKDHGLTQDGIAGARTFKCLKEEQ